MDAQFIYSEDKADTTIATHDSTNTHVHGNQRLPANQPLWLMIVVTTAYTSGGSATGQFKYLNDAVEIFDSGAIAVASLTVGSIIAAVPVSASDMTGTSKVTLDIATAVMTAGAYSAFLTTNPNLNYT
jgi:hypothetical protein